MICIFCPVIKKDCLVCLQHVLNEFLFLETGNLCLFLNQLSIEQAFIVVSGLYLCQHASCTCVPCIVRGFISFQKKGSCIMFINIPSREYVFGVLTTGKNMPRDSCRHLVVRVFDLDHEGDIKLTSVCSLLMG